MAWSLTSPITGSAQTGLTSPTYTHVADTAPDFNGKQVAISALGGTQTGVTVHSVSSPFTITAIRPKVLKLLQAVNPLTGLLKVVPRNIWGVIVRKGVTPMAGQPVVPMLIRISIEVPAGAETYDAPNVRAAISAAIGALTQQSAGLGDSAVSGTL